MNKGLSQYSNKDLDLLIDDMLAVKDLDGMHILYRHILNGDLALESSRALTEKLRSILLFPNLDNDEILKIIDRVNQKCFESALELIELQIKNYPHAVQLRDLKAVVLIETKDFGAAAVLLEEVKKDINHSFPILYNLGCAYLGNENYIEAVENLELALAIKPENYAVNYNLGLAYQNTQQYNKARVSYQRAMSFQKTPEVLKNLAIVNKNLDFYDEAQKVLEMLIDLDPKDIDGILLLGKIKARDSLWDVVSLYEEFLSHTKSLEIACELSRLLMSERKFLEAKSVLETYSGYMVDERLYYGLAVAYAGLYEHELADEYLEKLRKLQISNPRIFSAIGYIEILRENYEEAYIALLKSYKQSKDDNDVLVNFFTACYQLKKYSECLELYNDHDTLRDHPGINLNVGNYYSNIKGDVDSALDCYLQSAKSPELIRDACNNLTFILPQIVKDRNLDPSSLNTLLKDIPDYYRHLLIWDIFSKHANNSHDLYLNAKTEVQKSSKGLVMHNSVLKNPQVSQKFKSDPIALFNFGRSGTGMLHALMDNHSELITLPSVYWSEFFNPVIFQELTRKGYENIFDNLKSLYGSFFDARLNCPALTKSGASLSEIGQSEGLLSLGPNRNEFFEVEAEKFRNIFEQVLSSYKTISPKSIFETINISYDIYLHATNVPKSIFYHIHNPDNEALFNFLNSYQNPKLLILVRNPIKSCDSWISKTNDDYSGVVSRVLKVLNDTFNEIYAEYDCIGVKLEDIKTNPVKTLPALCRWMQINEEPSIFEMTVQGKKWWGDPSSPDYAKDGMKPFGLSSLQRPLSENLSLRDEKLLQVFFHPFNKNFGYPTLSEDEFMDRIETIPAQLNKKFAFEKIYESEKNCDLRDSTHFRRLRIGLLEKYKLLKQFGTYPNMLKPLKKY